MKKTKAMKAPEKFVPRTAKEAYQKAQETGHAYKAGEHLIALSSLYSILYATRILKGRFKEGEKAIATHAWRSFEYARDILFGRFRLGEEVLKKSPHWDAYWTRVQGDPVSFKESPKKRVSKVKKEVGIAYLGRVLDI